MTHIYRWDLDKTYLRTEFDTVGDIVRTAFQSAEEKTNIPGTAALMRELRTGPDGETNRIHIVSGSPRQLRRVLLQKLRLDGVEVDSLTLKPNLRNILKLRFRAVRDQLGYKLPTLLEARLRAPGHTLETCFGDDAEMDGIVYSLYHDICRGAVRGDALVRILKAARLYSEEEERVLQAADRLPRYGPVARVLIHLETGSPTARFRTLRPLVAPTFNTFQAALVLFADGRLSAASVARVSQAMIEDYGYDGARLQRSMDDAVRRGIVEASVLSPICQRPGFQLPSATESQKEAPARIDYVGLLGEVHTWQEQRRARRKSRGDALEKALGSRRSD